MESFLKVIMRYAYYSQQKIHRNQTENTFVTTRGSTHGLFPKHSNLKYGRRSFASYGCKVWNSLDGDVQAIEEPKRFKKALRERLLDKTKI